jgi:hypothetical protein
MEFNFGTQPQRIMQGDKNRKGTYSIARIVAGTVPSHIFKRRKLNLKNEGSFCSEGCFAFNKHCNIVPQSHFFSFLFSSLLATLASVFQSCYLRFQDHSLINVQLCKVKLPSVMEFSPVLNDVGWTCPTCGLRRAAYGISHSSGMLKK